MSNLTKGFGVRFFVVTDTFWEEMVNYSNLQEGVS